MELDAATRAPHPTTLPGEFLRLSPRGRTNCDGSFYGATTFQPSNSFTVAQLGPPSRPIPELGLRARPPYGPLSPEFPREVSSAFGSSRSRLGPHMCRYPGTQTAVVSARVQRVRRSPQCCRTRLLLLRVETRRPGPFRWNAASGPARSCCPYLSAVQSQRLMVVARQ
jgi:hypothetical protein